MTERTNDDLNTPEWILDLVRQMGPIGLDPCSNPWSTVGAAVEYRLDRGEDGLKLPWLGMWPRSAFVNFPYSKPLPWCQRIENYATLPCPTYTRMAIFALCKCAPSTKWWKVLMSVASARVDFHKRITFEGGAHKSGTMDSTMFYAGPSPYLFAHIFSPHGEVRVYR